MMDTYSESPIRSLSNKWLELLLVTMVLTVVLVSHHMVAGKQVVLHFFYLPAIIAAHYFGRRVAGATALLAVLAVAAFAMLSPERYLGAAQSQLGLALTLSAWGAFLTLNAVLFGTLCEQRADHIRELREAHVGIIEILSKYLQSTDRYTKSHSMRVAEFSEEIAREMQLKPHEIEDVRVGALLHDIGKVEISTQLIKKAAKLTESEEAEMATHTFHGAELVRSLGSILSGAVPLILRHHDQYVASSPEEKPDVGIPLGARIIAVADTYDAIVTDRPYRAGRSPQEAVAVIREASGVQLDPEVVKAFERVIRARLEEQETDKIRKGSDTPAVAGATFNVEIPAPRSAHPESVPDEAESPSSS